MKRRRLPVYRYLLGGLHLVAVPTLLVCLLMLACVGGVSAKDNLGLASKDVRAAGEPPTCQSCHPEEYTEWENSSHATATVDSLFQTQLALTKNPAACLPCHSTGYDPQLGTSAAENVTCEACHSPYTENHPADALMELPRTAETCATCHSATFREWKDSKHAEANIECFDCHKAHSQELRLGNYDELCTACHTDQKTELAHAAHGIEGGACTNCHMTHEVQDACSQGGSEVLGSNHVFDVNADVCTRCHAGAHNAVASTAPSSMETNNVNTAFDHLTEQADRVPELEQQVIDLQQRLRSLQNLSVIGIGLALGGGGFLGLVVGLGALALRKRSRSDNE